MGYRVYLGKISKKKYSKIKNLTIKDLNAYFNEEVYGPYKICDYLYELGKCPPNLNTKINNFFINKETNDHFNLDQSIKLANKELFKEIITSYQDSIKKYYLNYHNAIQKDDDGDETHETKDMLRQMKNHITRMKIEWNNISPINLETENSINKSDMFEYAIFELIYLYKQFDWENDELIIYGY